jgi:hypothetical protein
MEINRKQQNGRNNSTTSTIQLNVNGLKIPTVNGRDFEAALKKNLDYSMIKS